MLSRFNRLVCLLPAVTLVLAIVPVVHAGSLEGIDMCWKPQLDMDDLVKGAPDLSAMRVEVTPFRDTRFHPEIIGDARLSERVAKKAPARNGDDADEEPAGRHDDNYLTVTTSDNVAAWATKHFAQSLDDAGVKVVGSGGDLRITGEIVQLVAVKGPDYNGDLAIRIAVENDNGVVWKGTASGWARYPDGDWDKGKAKRYCSVLSDALLRAVSSLIWYPRFREALGGEVLTPPPAPDPTAPQPPNP